MLSLISYFLCRGINYKLGWSLYQLNSDDFLSLFSIHSVIEEEAVTLLCNICDGDARAALNCLQLAVESCLASQQSVVRLQHIKESLQRSHVQYDRLGKSKIRVLSSKSLIVVKYILKHSIWCCHQVMNITTAPRHYRSQYEAPVTMVPSTGWAEC